MSTPQASFLADHIHLAWVGADVVTLNLRDDVYGLIVDGAAVIHRLDGRRIETPDAAVFATLSDAGLIQTSPSSPPPPAKASLAPLTALLPGDSQQAPLLPRISAALGAVRATRAFRRRALMELVSRSAAPSAGAVSAEPLARTYAAFDAVLPWVPFEGQCLQRAYMLSRHLRRQGHAADWILGVRTWPFLAHAWVQAGSVVVGDSLERIRGFTPILVV